jgi:hypothetical protein
MGFTFNPQGVSQAMSEQPGATAATGGAADHVFYENDTTVNRNYTITTGRNAVSAGTVTIASGGTVTIPSGSAWVVV